MPYEITDYTYGTAIQAICRRVGHPVAVDPAGSTDPAVIQMGAAINSGLEELLGMHEWQDLTIKDSLSIVADSEGQQEKAFDLPEDWFRFVNQTQWSSGSLLPAMGPVSPQAWMLYTVRDYNPQLTLSWQIRQDQLYVLNPPYPDAVDFEFMYLSKAQVVDADDSTLLKNQASKNNDTFVLDSNMVMLLGRARYLEWKGFDASAAMRDFLTAFNSRAGAGKGAPVLSLSRPRGIPLIDPLTSLPDTGYGS